MSSTVSQPSSGEPKTSFQNDISVFIVVQGILALTVFPEPLDENDAIIIEQISDQRNYSKGVALSLFTKEGT